MSIMQNKEGFHYMLYIWNLINDNYLKCRRKTQILMFDIMTSFKHLAHMQCRYEIILLTQEELTNWVWTTTWIWCLSEPLNPCWPDAGETPGSWRMNHHHVNHIRCLFLFLLVFTSQHVSPILWEPKLDKHKETLTDQETERKKWFCFIRRFNSCPHLCKDKTNRKKGTLTPIDQ